MDTWIKTGRRWQFLRPWTCVLNDGFRKHLCELQPSPFDSAVDYMAVIPPDDQKEAQMTREGLKLLAAVAYVDYNAWRCLLYYHCGVRPDPEREIIVRFQVRTWCDDRTVQNLVEMYGAHQHDRPSREYSEALAKISAMDTKHHSNRGVEIPVPIEVELWGWDKHKSLEEYLNLRDAGKILQQEWDGKSVSHVKNGDFRCTFVLETAMKAKLSAYQVDLEEAEKFEELVHDNQWFSHVSLGLNVGDRLQSDARPKREVLGQLCTTLFDITRRSYFESPTRYVEADSHAPIRRQQLDLVSIWTHEQSRSEWEALCSAAILGQTTRKLELTHVERPWYSKRWDSKRWEWLAYAFFSKRVRSSLEVLALNRIKHMGTEEMEAFCAVLSSENPEAVLLGCPDGLASIQDATLAADSPIRWDFDEQGEPVLSSDVLKVASPIPFLRITSGSEEIEWVDAIVPGYGRCQVQRENLVLIEEVDVIPGKNLKALELHFTKWSLFNRTPDIRGLPLFLAAVGPSLKTLTIGTGDVHVLVDVKMVLERCPNLEKFCLMRQKDVAVLNFSDYHAAGSPLPAITINLDDVPAFAEEMLNTDSALANCLQRLTIHQGLRWSTNPELEPMLEALLKMLESNDHLEYLCVNFFYEYEEEYADRFWKFHLQPINRSVKLDIESKTAFLSVLLKTSLPQNEQRKRVHQPGNKRMNWEHLDANVVTNIFQFAAAPVLRIVYVRVFDAADIR